jgi:hypothetical protein
MTAATDFHVDIYQNEYLPAGGREVNAIATVTSSGTGPAVAGDGAGPAAEVIIVDCSGSMDYPRAKMEAAKQATAAAIGTLRDGVEFAVVAGTDKGMMVYPQAPQLVPAGPATKAEAIAMVNRLVPRGGTAIGRWLGVAHYLFGDRTGLKHTILLTDGRNEYESAAELDAVLRQCEGAFVCDCRGVGTDWVVAELRKIAEALLGTVDIVANPADLAADFRAMATAAMGKSVADVALRLWTPRGATIKFVKQVAPDMLDLTGKRVDTGPQTGDYPTGAWGSESRDYHVCVAVEPGKLGDVMLASRASLVRTVADTTEVLGQGLIRAIWTDDVARSTRISPEVAHYTGQAELASAIQEGLAARRDGDLETATSRLGRAVKLAAESGNAETAALLAGVVDVVDARTGTVRLKSKISAEDAMTLDTRSTKTSRVRKQQ